MAHCNKRLIFTKCGMFSITFVPCDPHIKNKKHMNISSFLLKLLVCCFLVFPSCQALTTTEKGTAEAQIPGWYLEGRSLEYPASLYIVGVGEGQNPEDAAGQARASVGSQIRVQVDSEITSITREMDSGDRYSFETIYNSATTSRIEQHMQGLEIALQAAHAGRYYALTALNRQRFLTDLRSDLDRLQGQYNSMINSGREHIANGHIFAGITSFLDAQNHSTDFYAALSTYNALADRPYASGDVLGMAGLVPEIRSALTAIRLSVISGDNQTGSSGRQLSEPLVIQAVYTGGDREVSMPNLPVRIEYQDGTEADRVVTDSEGLATVYLMALPVRREINQVIAQPLFTEIPSNYRNVVRNMAVRATYRITQEDRIPVAVVISDDSGRRLGQVEQRIASAVERLGYGISDQSGVVVEGTVSQLDARDVTGIGGSHIVVRSELQLAVKERGSYTVIGSLAGQGTGMSPRSEAEALRASHNRINVDRRELAEALSGITAQMAAALAPPARQERPERPPATTPPTATPPGPTPPVTGTSITKITIDDMTFDVRSAEMTNDHRVIIQVLITNHDYRDRQISFARRDFSIYDQAGHSSTRPILSIGTNRAAGSWSSLNHLLVSQVPTTLTMEFRDVNPVAENISLLNIAAGRTIAQLRNIPLEKQ